MKSRGGIVLLAVVAFLFASCSKEDIALPESNNPVFQLEGTIGAEEIALVAGDDNAYMHTFTTVANGVNIFSGKLGDGATSVEIGVYDGNIDQDKVTPLSVIKQSDKWAYSSGQDLVIFSKGMFPNHQMISQISWTINGAFAGINTVKISEPGIYDVCAMVSFQDGSTGTLCNEIIVGFVRNANFRMRHYANQAGELNVWLDDVIGEIESMKWYIDGEFVGKKTEYSGNVSANQHLVTVEVDFVNGTSRTKSMVVDGSVTGHFIDDFTGFEQCIQNVVHRDYNWLIKLEHNGEEYSSLFSSNTNSTLNVESIEYYGLNSSGKKVYKINATVEGVVRKIGTSVDKQVSFNTTFGLEIAD